MSSDARATRASRTIDASRDEVYAAFLDADAVAAWLPPQGMTGVVRAFEPEPGGRFSMTLTYDDPSTGPGGKTTEDSDVFDGSFAELEPDERVVWLVKFTSDDPDLEGTMRVAWDLEDRDGGTLVTCMCEGIPPWIKLEDNEAGTRSSLDNLARLVEGQP